MMLNILLTVSLSGCSLYESSGREAIQKNQSDIVGTTFLASGMDPKLSHYYVCARSRELPNLLREPLEVLETPFESENISVLLNTQSSPVWMAIYRHNEAPETHDYCKIYLLKAGALHRNGHVRSRRLILQAARIGVEQLRKASPSSRQ